MLAGIVGRKFGSAKWPFAPDKSVQGTAAFVAGGFLASLGVVSLFATYSLTNVAPKRSHSSRKCTGVASRASPLSVAILAVSVQVCARTE